MTDATKHFGSRPGGLSATLLETMASKALYQVATKPGQVPFRDEWVTALCEAVCDPDWLRKSYVIQEMLNAGVPPLSVVEDYCAEAARVLGEGWCDDTRSFAQVSIGVARLQSVIRDLFDAVPSKTIPHVRDVAVLVRGDEQHTLGSIIVANRLRHEGHSVWLGVGRSDNEIITHLARRNFDMVLISVAHEHNFENLNSFIDQLRMACSPDTPIAVGGSALLRVTQDEETAPKADFVSANIQDVLARLKRGRQKREDEKL